MTLVDDTFLSEFGCISDAAWKRLLRERGLRSAASARDRGKSWMPAMFVFRDHIAPDTPVRALREAVLWHMRDQGNRSANFFAEPRVFPVLKSAEDVA